MRGDGLAPVAGEAVALQPVLVVDHPEWVAAVAAGFARDRDVPHGAERGERADAGPVVALFVGADFQREFGRDEAREALQGLRVDPAPGAGIGAAEPGVAQGSDDSLP